MPKIFSTTTKVYFAIIIAIVALSILNVVLAKYKVLPNKIISGAIVPHHNMVAGERYVFFEELSTAVNRESEPETIILVSPNHYFAGMSKIQTTTKEWQISNGKIEPEIGIINKLLQSRLATNEPGSFMEEHGIYNILSDLKTFFPNSKIVPIMIQNASEGELAKMNSVLTENCKNCLMIASVDFSHYQPALVAELHDLKTIRELQNLNPKELLKNVEVDSGSSLVLLTMWAKQNNTLKFNLRNHTNSNLLLKQPDIEGTSHLFGWYENGEQVTPDQFVSFVISDVEEVGIENRTIWGTDMFINEVVETNSPDAKIVLLGKITNEYIEFFAIPINKAEPYSLISSPKKQVILKDYYAPYAEYLQSSEGGQYIKIPLTTKLTLNNLSFEQIKSKIKSSIKLNP